MFLNYLKLSFRLLARNPFFTLINLLGLSVGFASFFGLWRYASTELRSDQHYLNHDRIARMGVNWRWSDDGGKTWGLIVMGHFSPKIANQIKSEFPEIEEQTRILNQPAFNEFLVGHKKEIILSNEKEGGNKTTFKETKVVYADPNLFEFFSIPLLQGEGSKVLREQNAVVLSESTSHKYFGNSNPIGELLVLNGAITLKVSGVFQDLPNQTHLDFDMVISNVSMEKRWDNVIQPFVINYVRVRQREDFNSLERKINLHNDVYWAELIRQWPMFRPTMFIQPLDEIAFSQNFIGDYFNPKSRPMLIGLEVVSVLVLVLAWVNYVNLTLARTAKRLKELAARKVAGARTVDFLKQFLMESALVNILAVAIAFTLLQVARTPAQLLLNIVSPGWDSSWESILFFAGVISAGIIITGLYPAVISRRYTVRALFSKTLNKNRPGLSSVLTTFQYASAMALMLCALAMYLQLSFIFSKAQNGLKDRVIIVEAPIVRTEDYFNKMKYLTERIASSQHVNDITFSYDVVGDLGYAGFEIKSPGNSLHIGVDSNGGVNENFIPFFDIHLLAGRNFKSDDRADVVMLSRIATERLGFDQPEAAVGTKVFIGYGGNFDHEAEVIGVIEDYRMRPYFSFSASSTEYSQSGPGIGLTYENHLFKGFIPERLAIKMDATQLKDGIAGIERLYSEVFPGNVFTFYFLDEHINSQYYSEEISRNQILFFTLLAIGIACLGLLGMIANKAVEKTKEIGIRKVLGARLYQIAQIMLSATIKQVVIATLIGIPVAYYLTQGYLEKYAERISLQWWQFAVPVVILVAIMFLTIASVLWNAAKSNPVEALKYE